LSLDIDITFTWTPGTLAADPSNFFGSPAHDLGGSSSVSIVMEVTLAISRPGEFVVALDQMRSLSRNLASERKFYRPLDSPGRGENVR
jgi:hypothetical protein